MTNKPLTDPPYIVFLREHQEPLDADGIMVGVSRQAVDETLDFIRRERESVAQWMLANSYATGHGDTTQDLIAELDWQHKERLTTPPEAPLVDKEGLAKFFRDRMSPPFATPETLAQEGFSERWKARADKAASETADALISSGQFMRAPTEVEMAAIIEQAIHGVEWTAGKRPSIDELEAMLKADETPSIRIFPDGSITAGEPREEAVKAARAIRSLMEGKK